MLEIALASRELHPFVPGGIGTYLNALARVLSPLGRVTLFTSEAHEPRFRELSAAGDPSLPGDGVRFVWVPEPESGRPRGFHSYFQRWSANLHAAIRDTYPAPGPDLIEFPDYLGEGSVTFQAHRALDPGLSATTVCVRLHTTVELGWILDGELGRDHDPSRTLTEQERGSLRWADRALWAGGDILGTYRRFYGSDALAPAARVRHPLVLDAGEQAAADAGASPGPDGPLALLYFGRLERRKGVQNLLRALTGLGRDDWRLTMVGADTATAPLRLSMREQLELMAAGDERIELRAAVPRHEVPGLLLSHHAIVVPSLWECWPGVALEALSLGRPLVATPTGGLAEIARPGVSGWLTRDTGAASLADTLLHVLDHRDEVEELIASGRPRRHGAELTDHDQLRDDYAALAQEGKAALPGARSRPRRPPLASVVIPYAGEADLIEDAVAAACTQEHPAVETIVVNDGAMREEDGVLGALAERWPVRVLTESPLGRPGSANAGIAQSAGRYVVALGPECLARPTFLARAVELLEARSSVAYASCWSDWEGEEPDPEEVAPLGNHAQPEPPLAGAPPAVLRRSLFDLGFRYPRHLPAMGELLLYRRLAEAGRFGAVIPERLVLRRRRSRPVEQPGERLLGRLNAVAAREGMQWESSSA